MNFYNANDADTDDHSADDEEMNADLDDVVVIVRLGFTVRSKADYI